jgi:hypothetical protein
MNFTITSEYCPYKPLTEISDGKLVFKYALWNG